MSTSLERRSSCESAGLKKPKWRSENAVFSCSIEDAVKSVRNWIEDCTENQNTCKCFLEFVHDGVVLCELIQNIKPGLIKKINRVKSRFAYWENFSFFLDSCRNLGLQEWQLFDPEEVLSKNCTNKQSPTRETQQRKLQNITSTLFWLARAVQQLPNYCGPELDLSPFNNKSYNFSGSIGNLSSVSSTPSSTPEHKSLSVTYPNTDQHKTSPPYSPGINSSGTDSPLLWVQKVNSSHQDSYQFTPSDSFFDEDNAGSQTSVGSDQYITEEYPKKRRSSRVETHHPPQAYSADLVFIHGSTSSSVISPTHLDTSAQNNNYSPHHLSNTFGGSDHIDNTGLLIDPINYHSQVFTVGSGSQDSGPHFSQRSETTFHVNLTQTSQPDNLSSGTIHLEEVADYPLNSELPSISETANNSCPIDTFDLHHSRPTANSGLTTAHHQFSQSQEYRDQYTPQLDTRPEVNFETNISNKQSLLHENSAASLKSEEINSSSSSSNASVIVVSYTATHRNSEPSQVEQDNKLTYRRYSSPQQRLFKGSRVSTVTVSHLHHTPSSPEFVTITDTDFDDIETDMALNKMHRSSGKRQMRVVPSGSVSSEVSEPSDKENSPPSLIDNTHATDINIILMPGEKELGFIISENFGKDNRGVCVKSVTGDSPASRAGLKPGDKILSVNQISLKNKKYQSIVEILQQATAQRKLSLTIHRDILLNDAPIKSPHNGFQSDPPRLSHIRINKLSLDLQRVESGALPKHMIPSKVVCTEVDDNVAQNDGLLESSEILSDINSTAVEIGSSVDTDSHHTLSSVGANDVESRSELNQSPSLPSVDEIQEPINENESHHPVVADSSYEETNFTSEIQQSASDDNLKATSGKSQSVTSIPEHNKESSDVYLHAYFSHTNIHKKATKTESLPVQFRNFAEICEGLSNFTSSGLGLQNLSIEDVHSASKQQMDQIWQEVESSSSVTSPQEINNSSSSHSHPLDSVFATVSDEHNAPRDTPIEKIHENKDTNNNHSYIPVRRSSSSKSNINKGIDALLSTLRSLNEKVGTYEEEEEFKLLEELLQSNKFRKAKEFHDNMRALVTHANEAPVPHTLRIVPQVRMLRHTLRENKDYHRTQETDELRQLLRKPQVQAALFCHDKVATKDLYVPSTYFPKSAQDHEDIILSHSALDLHNIPSLFVSQEAPLSREVPSSRKENATIVYLERSNRPIGCTIYKQGDAVFVGKLLKGCDAEQSNVLREGDELLEINGIALVNKSTDEIIRLMSGEAGKILVFTLIPVHDDSADIDYEEKYVRAHFSYNGQLDEEVPCKELTLNFAKGEILEISNQDDPDWWQARKVFDDGGESLPGLIPARHLQQKREVLRESYVLSVAMEEKSKRKGILSKFSRKKKKKIYYNQGPMSGVFQSVGHEVATYEDVVKLMPDPSRRRPIVLIGAPSVGRRTLMKKLIDSYPRHYSVAIPHTTRPMKSGELNGREYHFVTRDDFEQKIQSNEFLEYGETRGNLYGVSIKAVKRVINDNKVPVLDLNPQALKVIGSSGLIPYIIYVGSPRLDRLLMTRRVTTEKHKKKMHTSVSADALNRDIRAFTESELLQLYHNSQEIQSEYGHYFDWVIVNDDLQVAADMLMEVARRIEEEPQWIPATWVEEV